MKYNIAKAIELGDLVSTIHKSKVVVGEVIAINKFRGKKVVFLSSMEPPSVEETPEGMKVDPAELVFAKDCTVINAR